MPSETLPSTGGDHMHKHLLLILLFRPDPLLGLASILRHKMSIVPE